MRKFRDIANIPNYKLKTFSEFLLNEGINYTYKVPFSPEKQLFDFYLWTLFHQYGLKKILPGSESNKQDLELIIEDAIEKITDSQQKLLLSAGLTSIASELRYVRVFNTYSQPKNWFTKNKFDYSKFDRWITHIFGVFGENVVPAEGKGYLQDRAGKSIISSGYQPYEFVELAQRLFDELNWNRNYGGKAWGKICEGWKQLYNANSLNDKIKAIDNMYDLQHNTGFALNKAKDFSGNWINTALDLKYNGNVWDLVKNSSIPNRISGYLVRLSGVGGAKDKDKDKDKEREDLTNYTHEELYKKALALGKRWLAAEPIIMKDYSTAYFYAKNVIQGRWPEAEPIIMKNPLYATYYARDVIKGRWPEAELAIAENSYIAYLYARDVIKGRWPEAEPIIMKDPGVAYEYAKNVIKGRWPEAEPYIMKDPYHSQYYKKLIHNNISSS